MTKQPVSIMPARTVTGMGKPRQADSIASYVEFLSSKAALAEVTGLEIDDKDIHPILKPHQRAAVRWAVRGGKRALFESFGLGKSVQQLEIIRLILQYGDTTLQTRRGLIVMPLGVRQEFIRDAAMLGTTVTFIRTIEEAAEAGIYLTNYETIRDGKLDPSQFMAVSLDEAAILRSFGGTKTFREFMRILEPVPYRFVATATPDPNEFIELLAYAAFLGIMDVSQAKAQPLDAKILTPTGWKIMADIKVGDSVISGEGKPTKVIGVFPQGERPVYRVTFSDGSSTECDADHLWLTKTQLQRNNEHRYLKGTGRKTKRHTRTTDIFGTVKTTAEIAETISYRGGFNHSIPMVKAVEFESQQIAIPPWLLGFLLGDGYLRRWNVSFSTKDDFIVDRVQREIPSELVVKKRAGSNCDYDIANPIGRGKRNVLVQKLRAYGLNGKRSHEKHVPSEYLFNTIDVRLEILRGLMDSDGTCDKINGPMFCTTSRQLSEDMQFLVQSLGGSARTRQVKTQGMDAFIVRVSLPNNMNPFSIPRKAKKVFHKVRHGATRMVESVELVGMKPSQCIAIEDQSRLYVTDNFIVTHNTRWFKRDSTKADKLTIHSHKENEFWLWVASWALFIQTPADLGFSDEGYLLPDLDIHWHEVESDHSKAGLDRDGQSRLFIDAASSITAACAEKKRSLKYRIAKAQELKAENPDAHCIFWHDLEVERLAIEEAFPQSRSVYGSQDLEERESVMADFADGRLAELAAKPCIAGAGCNLQRHCSWAIFTGIGFKFNEFIQAVHRIHRFLQLSQVRIDLIYTEAERNVRQTLEDKWRRYKEQCEKMQGIIRKFGLAETALGNELRRTIGVTPSEVQLEDCRLINGDAVIECHNLESDSAGLLLTSIPFSSMYEYSPSVHDFGFSESNSHFWEQMDFLTPNLFRILQPGRLMIIHVKDRIVPSGMTGLGFQTVSPLHAEAITHYRNHGFGYMGMKTITTDVVRENNQTYRLGWTEQCKDGSKMGCGMPEYLLIFRKPPTDTSNGYADEPVVKSKDEYSLGRWQIDAHGYLRSNGERFLDPMELAALPHDVIYKLYKKESLSTVYDYQRHVALGDALKERQRLPVTFMLLPPHSPHPDVWSDVAKMRTLNMMQQQRGNEMHLCPMQFDVANRVIEQYSMKDEVVFDPFGGLMTVPYCALQLGRKALAIELSEPYFQDGVAFCKEAIAKRHGPTLFDLLDVEQEEVEVEPS